MKFINNGFMDNIQKTSMGSLASAGLRGAEPGGPQASGGVRPG